ncbi:putative ABC transport system ATP-binding protein [Lachnospiraceae bacterium PF1-21]|nr:ABC transporter ATP-binding protein [Lachnospiraceae bacterium OttesenSCG-928-J05]
MVKIYNLSKVYRGRGIDTPVLSELDIHIEKGEFVVIYGKSGCGKTTLLNIIGLIDTATSGEYFFNGKNVKEMKNNQLARERSSEIGFIFQAFYLIPELTAFENVVMPMEYAKVPRKERKKRGAKLLDEVEMLERANFYPSQLSGGEKQRVAIARALANQPGLLLADEPTGSLDERNRDKIMDILSELNRKGVTIVMVTHDKDLSTYATRCIYL